VSGRIDEALEAGRRGIALEPHSANAQASAAWSYAGVRRFAEALPGFRKAVLLEPNAPFPLWSLAFAQQQTGALEEAIGTLQRAVTVTQREHCFEIALLGGALAAAGRVGEARSLLAELQERARREYVPPFDRALLLAALGEREEALSALEKAYEDRNGLLWYRIHLPTFDPLRDEPRWRALADKLASTAPLKPGGGW
jgi:tetratricopeptide (TPR) repeat protein